MGLGGFTIKSDFRGTLGSGETVEKMKSDTCTTHSAAHHFEMDAVLFLRIFRPRGCNYQFIFVFSSLLLFLITITRSCRMVGGWVGGWMGGWAGGWVGGWVCG